MNHLAVLLRSSLLVGGVLAACSLSSNPETTGDSPFVFPQDTPFVGGETTDWGTDDLGACRDGDLLPIDEAEARTIDENLDEIHALLDREWVEDVDWLICSPGKCDTTRLHVDFEVTETYRLVRSGHWEATSGQGGAGGAHDRGHCNDGLAFDATVKLRTDDGQLEGSFEIPKIAVFSGPIYTPPGLGGAGAEQPEPPPDHYWGTEGVTLVAGRVVNLREFRGEMEIIANPERSHWAMMGFLMVLNEEQPSGLLMPHVEYLEGESTSYGFPRAKWGKFYSDVESATIEREGNVTLSNYRGSNVPPKYGYELHVKSKDQVEVTTRINGATESHLLEGSGAVPLGSFTSGTVVEAWATNSGDELRLSLESDGCPLYTDECLEVGCESRLMVVTPELPCDTGKTWSSIYWGATGRAQGKIPD